MSRALLSILVSGHGDRLNTTIITITNDLDDEEHTGGFDPVAEFPPDEGLPLAVLYS